MTRPPAPPSRPADPQGHDVADERRYQAALERMVSTANSRSASLADTVTALLAIGLDFFDMDVAGIGRFIDGVFEVEHVQARDGEVRLPFSRIPAEETLGAMTHDHNEPVAIEDLSGRAIPSPIAGAERPIKSFIGQRIEVAGAIYGTVMFCGLSPRTRPFRPNEITLQRLLAQWMAFVFERHDQMAALNRRRAELQVVLENVPAHVLTRAPDGRALMANAAARALEAPAESVALDMETLAEGVSRLGHLERWEDADGQVRWMRADRIPFPDPATAEPRLLVLATDVTELIEKEQALARANEGLNQFTFIASHDLQEPLRKIGTFADILGEGLATGNAADVTYAAEVIRESARRASRLIKDLLAWSRLAHKPIEPQSVPLDHLVRETVAEVLSARPDATVAVADRMDPLVVRADPTQVRQLVENLVVNALKYAHPDRPPALTLRLGRPTPSGPAVLEVEDNGIGFAPEHAVLIFEPFRRLHTEKRYPGSGIGLAICAKVCERHGWTIDARGSEGEGATFRVEIPRRAVVAR
ncbi:sensor histidine kinase [Chthonobacter rhizosphaerae]|uniref:sensor histidine kinase n=1 Tax=Chthonobacter rhizosphaerae TaxID=2735553 RepID=UPI0015EF4955|nr:ATP-binding protein [Chthonobacter rhizosphaerae]